MTDVHAADDELAADDVEVRPLEVDVTRFCRLHFGPRQRQTALEPIEEFIVMERTRVFCELGHAWYTSSNMAARKEEERHGSVITISTGTIFRSLLILLAAYLLYVIRDVVALFLVAVFIAVIIDPFAGRLQRMGLPRGLSVAIIYLMLLAVLAGLLTLVVPPMVSEFSQLATTFAPLLEDTRFAGIKSLIETGASPEGLGAIAASIQESGLLGALPQLGGVALGALGGVLGFFLILILAFYLVTEENVIRRGIALLAPDEYQPFVSQLSVKMREKVGHWLRGQLLIMLIVGLLDYGALVMLGIPYAIVLAIVAALCEVVPFIGPNVAVIPAAVIAFSVSPVHAVLVLAAYFVVQQIESNILTPKIMQRTTGLNPIITILAILIGFEIGNTQGVQGGVIGALLAIPLAMTASVFFNEVFRERAER